MNKNIWTVVVVVALVLLLAAGLFGNWGYGGERGMMGNEEYGGEWGMMGNLGFAPFGWIGMIFMWLIPIGFLVLTALGIVWLVRAVGGGNPTVPSRACPSCGRGVQPDWRNCPHCGATLAAP